MPGVAALAEIEPWPEETTPVQKTHGYSNLAEADRVLLSTEIGSVISRCAKLYADAAETRGKLTSIMDEVQGLAAAARRIEERLK